MGVDFYCLEQGPLLQASGRYGCADDAYLTAASVCVTSLPAKVGFGQC